MSKYVETFMSSLIILPNIYDSLPTGLLGLQAQKELKVTLTVTLLS